MRILTAAIQVTINSLESLTGMRLFLQWPSAVSRKELQNQFRESRRKGFT